jgi:hypothetical protein
VHRDAGRAHNLAVVATDLVAMLLQDLELVAKLIEVGVAQVGGINRTWPRASR